MTIAGRTGESRNSDVLVGNGILVVALLGAGVLVIAGIATKQISQFIYITVDFPGFCAVGMIAGLSAAFYYARSGLACMGWPATPA